MCSLKYLGLASCGTTQDDQFNIVSPRRLAARLSATARGSVPRQGVLSGANSGHVVTARVSVIESSTNERKHKR